VTGKITKIHRIHDNHKVVLICLEAKDGQLFYLSLREGQSVEFEVHPSKANTARNLTWAEDIDFVKKGLV